MKLILILSLFAFLSQHVHSVNILVLEGVPSPSHHIWIRTLTTELASQGYNVTSLSSDVEENPPANLHYLNLDAVYPGNERKGKEANITPLEFGDFNTWAATLLYNLFKLQYCEFAIESNGFKQLLNYPNNFKFDLILGDFTLTPCLIGFAHKFNYPPIVGISPLNTIYFTSTYVGSLIHPSYIPHGLFKTTKETFFDRVENYVIHMMDYFQNYIWITPATNKMLQPHFPGMPYVEEIQRKTKAVLMNMNFAMDVPEPLLPNVIPVGGLQIQRNRSLTEEFKLILDNSENVVLFSLGTNMKSKDLGKDQIIEILVAFQNLPRYTFIWKFETDSLPMHIPDNVIITPFVPQNDILAHPNTKLFISHCGLLSTQESVWHGVPILATPIFFDQFMVAENAAKMGIAEKYDIRNVDSRTFATTISSMFTDPKYQENIKRRSRLFKDLKESPLDTAVWWIKLILNNPDATFSHAPSLEMNIFQRHSVDVVIFLTLITVLMLYIEFKIIWHCLYKKKPDPNADKKRN